MNKNRLIIFLLLISCVANAKEYVLKKWEFTAYGEAYYSYDFSNPANHEKSDFLYNYKRHNELALNMGIAKVAWSYQKMRANFALMAGTYPQYNLSPEPLWAQRIYEANVGFRLSNTKNIWVDAGIFSSHIGFESAIGADCWTLTRSLLAENTPYYESGLKLYYVSPNKKCNLGLLYLNGWQRIARLDAQQNPCGGLQFTYQLHPKLLFNYSNFIGSVQPDSIEALRTYHNLYLQVNADGRLSATLGYDLARDRNAHHQYAFAYSSVGIVRFKCNNQYTMAFRAERYYDPQEVMIKTKTGNGFVINGYSMNLDRKLTDNSNFRIEAKVYESSSAIFSSSSRQNVSLTTCITVKL